MRDLTDELYAAVDSSPPSSIDIDRLITAERRRTRRFRWAAGGGAALSGLVAVAFLVSPADPARVDKVGAGPATGALAPVAADCPRASGGDRERHGVPNYTRDPRLTESCADATARLTAVLRPALSKVVPGLNAAGFVLNEYTGLYQSETSLTTAAGAGRVSVFVGIAEKAPTADECALNGPGCSQETLPGGSVVVVFDGTRDQLAHRVDVVLPDRTTISVHAGLVAEGADRHLPLSIAEVKALALALTPGLTLFP
jgi:hypothetical protein